MTFHLADTGIHLEFFFKILLTNESFTWGLGKWWVLSSAVFYGRVATRTNCSNTSVCRLGCCFPHPMSANSTPSQCPPTHPPTYILIPSTRVIARTTTLRTWKDISRFRNLTGFDTQRMRVFVYMTSTSRSDMSSRQSRALSNFREICAERT